MSFYDRISSELVQFKRDGVYKQLQHLESPQSAEVTMQGRGNVVVLSSNNYLGLSNNLQVISDIKKAVDQYGAGTASVRFICGTLSLHEELETKTAEFLGMEACTTYASCWNANEAVFPTLFSEGDIVISDAFNHASIIDGLRLMSKKVDKKVFPHSDMKALEGILKESSSYRTRAIVTDGVFSMEGDIAKLPELCELAQKYDALLIMDDSHSTGVLGKTGKGTMEHFGLEGQVDILTGTYGKALGGAAGGFIASKKEVIEYCVQRSRPQLFSNALPPAVAASALSSIRYLEEHPSIVNALRKNTQYFRDEVKKRGFKPLEGDTPIVPIIVGETALAINMSDQLLEKGVFVTGFGFPVVPQGEARLRIQMSAGHSQENLDFALEKLTEVGKNLDVI